MQTIRLIGAAAGVFALGLSACAQQLPSDLDVAGLQQAETEYPPAPPPLKDADKVDWRNAAQPPTDTAPNDSRSHFVRAQSLMAVLSAASYEPQAEFDRMVNPLGLFGNRITSGGGKWAADAYVGASEKFGMAFVAVRGTSNFADYLTDFLLVPVTSRSGLNGLPGSVHAGFALYQDALYSDVRAGVDVSCNPNLAADQKVPLWLTGHSLGAAAAAILAYRLKQDGCNVAGVSLFGTPRPGLGDFKDAYGITMPRITQRWTTSRDPIYCLPPGGAWEHVGTENKLDHGIHVGTGEGEAQCESPEHMIGLIRTTLMTIEGGFTFGSEILTQALLDWLRGVFNLGYVCPPDFNWKTAISFAACEVTDFGYDVLGKYGLKPSDILTAGFTLAMIRFHDRSRYVGGFNADFSDPPVEWVNVRVLLPNVGTDVVVREEIYQGVCVPTVLDERNAYCDFDAPVGYPIRITSEALLTLDASDPGCNRAQNQEGDPFVCELDVTGPRTLILNDGRIM